MKRNLVPLFFKLLAAASLLASCVRDVILDAGEAPQVVVECVLNTGNVQELYLNFTKGATKEEAEPLTDAVAALIDLTKSEMIGQFVRQEDDRWSLDYSAVPEHHYRLEVQIPDHDLIWAEDTMPKRIDVRAYTFTATEREKQPDRYLDIPEEYAYHFEATYYEFGEDFSGSLWIYGIDSDHDMDRSKGQIAAEIYADLPTADNFNISEKLYLPELEIVDTYIDGERKANGVKVIYPDLIGSSMHDRFIRINGGKAGDRFLLNCNFKQWWAREDKWWNEPTWEWEETYYEYRVYGSRFMNFMSLSDIYDQYLKMAYLVTEMKQSSDMSAIYLRDNLPSNIHGGIGVFGGKVEWFEKCYVAPTYVYTDEYPKYGIDEETHKYIKD